MNLEIQYMKTFNVVIATSGRDTLQRMVSSIAPQLTSNDYLTIIWDCKPISLQIDSNCQVITIQNEKPLGYWGHASRTRWQNSLPGDYIMNADDDDVYMHDAIRTVREYCTEDKLYVFQMLVNGTTIIPSRHTIEMANIGTPCGVYPSVGLPEWKPIYGGDFEFYNELAKKIEPVFINKLIYIVKPNDNR